MSQLSVSRLVKVNVILAALAAQAQNLSTILLLSSSNVIDVIERLRSYTSLVTIADDFGSSSDVYKAAQKAFAQQPQASEFKVGRWAKTATAGRLVGAPLLVANQSIAPWAAITTGSLKIGIDAIAPIDVTGMTFAAQTNLNGVASIMQTAIRAANAAFTAMTVKYNAIYTRFEFDSGTTGAASKVTFALAAATGVDISSMAGLRSTNSGAYVADGIVAETALDAAVLFDGQFGRTWYGMNIPEADDDENVDVAGFLEATNNKHMYGINTQDGGVLSTVVTDDIASRIEALSYSKTMTQYSSQDAHAVISLMAKAFSTNWNGNNTAITLMYKGEPSVIAESIGETQAQALAAKNCNVFVNYDNDTAIIQNGVVGSGDFIDTITGADAIAVDLQNELFNLLYTSPTKIPQTDAGTNMSVTTCERVCYKYVTNGYAAPGVWDQNGFGNLSEGDFLEKGFYVYAPPVASQSKPDRQARKSVPIQVALKCAGAVHSFDLQLNISR